MCIWVFLSSLVVVFDLLPICSTLCEEKKKGQKIVKYIDEQESSKLPESAILMHSLSINFNVPFTQQVLWKMQIPMADHDSMISTL